MFDNQKSGYITLKISVFVLGAWISKTVEKDC